MSVLEKDVIEVLKKINDPDLNRNIVDLGFVKDVKICDGNVAFSIELTTPACPVRDQMKNQALELVSNLSGVTHVDVKMTAQVRPSKSEQKEKMIPRVRNVVPIASGKGGVGKSTVSANLALSLHKMGARVGLIDADVYGPSIPTIMGVNRHPQVIEGKIQPIEQYGIKIISTGFFLKPGEAVIWRGPMLHKAIEQFLSQVDWGDLDYLLVDLPPGTGDIQLSLCQMIPLTGAVVISTPQDVALNIAEKAIIMFDKLNCPVLGIVENMSYFICTHCNEREEIFSSGGARRYCTQHGIPFLGEIPLATKIRSTSDDGHPIVASNPDSEHTKAFKKVAMAIAAQISIQNMSDTSKKPVPSQVQQLGGTQIKVSWKDGHESTYQNFKLRSNCSCAHCVDEMTGKKTLKENTIDPHVHPLEISPVGRYAIHIQWSDGHGSGIYSFENLRNLCPCSGCNAGKN